METRKYVCSLQEGFYPGSASHDRPDLEVYFIAMPKKLETVKQYASDLGLEKANFFKAIPYKNLDNEALVRKGVVTKEFKDGYLQTKKRVAAIHLSHTAALMAFLETQKQWGLFFEDDLLFDPETAPAKLQEYFEALATAPPGPQIHYFGFCYEPGPDDSKNKPVGNGTIVSATSPKCLHAYIVNRAGAKELVDNSFPQSEATDQMWVKLPSIKKYRPRSSVIMQNWEGVEARCFPSFTSMPGCPKVKYEEVAEKQGDTEKQEGTRARAYFSKDVVTVLVCILALLIYGPVLYLVASGRWTSTYARLVSVVPNPRRPGKFVPDFTQVQKLFVGFVVYTVLLIFVLYSLPFPWDRVGGVFLFMVPMLFFFSVAYKATTLAATKSNQSKPND